MFLNYVYLILKERNVYIMRIYLSKQRGKEEGSKRGKKEEGRKIEPSLSDF